MAVTDRENSTAISLAGLRCDGDVEHDDARDKENARVIKMALDIIGTMLDGYKDSSMTITCVDGILCISESGYFGQQEIKDPPIPLMYRKTQ